ncbi:hypothetical protein [Pseudalkalibacillus hwajinpoensis]|uniref:hypothetical protein n=1 Tax=Guptibacillus hwajinpoensis TaxID=208199 RepID=UPI001A7E88CB|nr:hypothetical protein [Pseudalkalibacillus hwajinpoensis]
MSLITGTLIASYVTKGYVLAIGNAVLPEYNLEYPFNPQNNSYHMWVYTGYYEIVDLAIDSIFERDDFKYTPSDGEITNVWKPIEKNVSMLKDPTELLLRKLQPGNGVVYQPFDVGSWEEIGTHLISMDVEDSKTLDQIYNTAERVYRECTYKDKKI